MKAGELFAGRFRIERHAGSGGMGAVYRAIDELTTTPVAIKVLSTERLRDLERFHREAMLLRDLHHPAIVRYIAHGTTATQSPFLAMEWVEGKTLSEMLEDGSLGVGASLRLALGVAGALAAAHERGVVHRDIKPHNIMLEGGGVESVKVLDFGIARYRPNPTATVTRAGMLLGTPGYIAPEQARGEPDVDARADVFSLGCVLFECLTGRAAFTAGDLIALLAKLVAHEPPPPSSVNADIPVAVDALVRRMLSKHPDARPADGGAVASQLQSILATLGPDVGRAERVSLGPMTRKELRLVTVVLASGSDTEASSPSLDNSSRVSLDEALASLGVEPERLADGTMLCSVAGRAVATDQAARAARCALILRSYLPRATIAIATGRALLAGPIPLGDVIDRAVLVLRESMRNAVPLPGRWIAIDELTAGLLDTTFDVRGRGDGLFLAGKREPLSVRRTLLGRTAPFVGRERDLAFLRACFDEAIEDHLASALLVTSPAGAGKSRLVSEFLERQSSAMSGISVWVARAESLGAGSSFAVVAQLIRRAAAIHDDEPIEVRRRKLHARVLRHMPESETDRVVAFLGELSATPFSPEQTPELRAARQDATLMREEIERAWNAFVAAECKAQPLVLVLEDLQWGDFPSVNRIWSTLRTLAHERLFVLAIGRPEVYDVFPGICHKACTQELRLTRLSRGASRTMIQQVLGADLPDATIAAIIERAGGNAFYLEELIRTVAQGRGTALPETLVAMMNARLEALDPDDRRLLRAASVFGDVFWSSGLGELLGRIDSDNTMEHRLRLLEAEELIERNRESRFQGEVEYAFRHALFREAVYATLIPRDRTIAHRGAAFWLERAGESDPMVKAEHFELGNESAHAVALYRRAAEQALDGNDLNAAIKRANRGIACGAQGKELGALRNVQGEVHALRGENTEAERCGTDVLTHMPCGSASWCWAAAATFTLRIQLGELVRARHIVCELGDVTPESGAELAYVRACAQATALLSHAGMHEIARAFVTRIDDVTLPSGQPTHVAMGWRCFARCHVVAFEGDAWAQQGAAEQGKQSFSLARSELGVAIMGVQRGVALLALGQLDDAATELSTAATKAARLGAELYTALAHLHEGVASAQLGDLAKGRALTDAAVTSFYRQGNPIYFGMARMLLAGVLHMAGDLEEAEREASEAALVLEAVPALRCACLSVQGAVILRRGRPEAALDVLEEAYNLLLVLGSISEGEAALRLAYAEALQACGRDTDAKHVLTAARTRLVQRAEHIEDEQARLTFLTRVAEHARTMQLSSD